MMKKVIAIVKIFGVCVGGVLAVIGLRALTIAIKSMTDMLPVFFQIIAWIILVVFAIAVWCNWYLRNNEKYTKDLK